MNGQDKVKSPNWNEWREKNKEKRRKYEREYYHKKRKEYMKKWRLEHKDYMRKYVKEHRKKLREKIIEVLGKTCVICGKIPKSNYGINYHEIHGKPHQYNLQYILKHKEDFICLCKNCHCTLHHYFNYKIQFDKWLKLLVNVQYKHDHERL